MIFDEAISILALNTFDPSSNSPFFILSNKSKFSSIERLRYGESLPGSVKVPRYSLICSGLKSQT